METEVDYPYTHEEYMELGKNWPKRKKPLIAFDEAVTMTTVFSVVTILMIIAYHLTH